MKLSTNALTNCRFAKIVFHQALNVRRQNPQKHFHPEKLPPLL
jgi:hypothetical protein